VFLTIGSQMVSATENALINTLETPLLRGMCGTWLIRRVLLVQPNLLRPWERLVVIVVVIATEMSGAASLLRHRAVRHRAPVTA
jgi:hypothetical protein